MAWMHPVAVEYRRQRFTRPDAGRYLKPDPERWLSLEELRLEYPELYEQKYGVLSYAARPSAFDILRNNETLRLRALSILRGAQVQIAMIRHELALRRKANFNHNQPRVPAGNPQGGRWTSVGVEQALDDEQTNFDIVADREDEELRELAERAILAEHAIDDELRPRVELAAARDRTRGHHYVTEEVSDQYPLSAEARRIFQYARTGRIPNPALNYYDKLHRTYNQAVSELFKEFLAKNEIDPKHMTSSQARSFLFQVIRSHEPRIRDLNVRIWRNIFRSGSRGTE